VYVLSGTKVVNISTQTTNSGEKGKQEIQEEQSLNRHDDRFIS
jgi:hypothetical protein